MGKEKFVPSPLLRKVRIAGNILNAAWFVAAVVDVVLTIKEHKQKEGGKGR